MQLNMTLCLCVHVQMHTCACGCSINHHTCTHGVDGASDSIAVIVHRVKPAPKISGPHCIRPLSKLHSLHSFQGCPPGPDCAEEEAWEGPCETYLAIFKNSKPCYIMLLIRNTERMHDDMLADAEGAICRWQPAHSVRPCSHLRYSATKSTMPGMGRAMLTRIWLTTGWMRMTGNCQMKEPDADSSG